MKTEEELQSIAGDLLTQLVSSVETIRSHSDGHPNADAAVERSWTHLRKILLDEPTLRIGQVGGKILVQKHVFEPANRASPTARFAILLAERQVKSVRFDSFISRQELKRFLQILARSPGDSLTGGTLRQALIESFKSLAIETVPREVSAVPSGGGAEDAGSAELARPPRSNRYLRGDWAERALGLTPLAQIEKGSSIVGVSRFTTFRPSRPVRAVTVVYRPEAAEAEVVNGVSPLPKGWTPEDPIEISDEDASLSTQSSAEFRLQAPPFTGFLTWSELRAVAREAKACEGTPGKSGQVWHRHQLTFMEAMLLDAVWANPSETEHPQAWRLVEFYRRILTAVCPAGMTPSEVSPATVREFRDLGEANAYAARRYGGRTAAEILRFPALAYLDATDREALDAAARALEALGDEPLRKVLTGLVEAILAAAKKAPPQGRPAC
ncbi:MAG: hypothetical protein HY720_25605 [Planctomycetes bacterium]|nr:hypothetical protein [Planctomycetota bacterium]